jgi:phage terminase small subunit
VRAPKGIGAAARAAYTRAAVDLDVRGQDRVVLQDALDRYVFSVDVVDRLRKRWEADGRPLLGEGGATGQAVVPHPLIAMIANAERDAARFAATLGLDPVSVGKTVQRKPGGQRGASRSKDRPVTGAPAKVVRLRG